MFTNALASADGLKPALLIVGYRRLGTLQSDNCLSSMVHPVPSSVLLATLPFHLQPQLCEGVHCMHDK